MPYVGPIPGGLAPGSTLNISGTSSHSASRYYHQIFPEFPLDHSYYSAVGILYSVTIILLTAIVFVPLNFSCAGQPIFSVAYLVAKIICKKLPKKRHI